LLDLWAYAVSPHGLGLKPEFFWSLAIDEYRALERPHRYALERWGLERAHFCNAHFKTDGVPWLPADFIGRGNRDQRIKQRRIDGAAVAVLNRQLAQMRPGMAEPEWLPVWARKDFDMSKPAVSVNG
jgi:hypothetical protein